MSDAAEVEAILRAALAGGAAEAEVFVKTTRGRRVVLEPAGAAGSRPRVALALTEERGVAVRVRDGRGRWGFAWRSPAPREALRGLVAEALAAASGASARSDPDHPGEAPCAAPTDAAAPAGEPTPSASAPVGLRIHDPRVDAAPDARIVELLEEAADAAAAVAGRSGAVDRLMLSAASSRIRLANSRGFLGEYDRSPALLSVAMAPGGPGPGAVLEERSSCVLADLDPRACGAEAARRWLPARPAEPPLEPETVLILEPRAAASLVSALVPWVLAGGDGSLGRAPSLLQASRGERGGLTIADDGRLPGMVGSAPFDGVGRRTGRTVLASGGVVRGRLCAENGNVVRPSVREPPCVGPTNLLAEGRAGASLEDRSGTFLRAAVARFTAGPTSRLRVLRGEWCRDGEPVSAADGLLWEGPIGRILGGVTAVGTDRRFFHLGLPIGTGSIRIEALGPWIVEARRPRAGAAPVRRSGALPRDAPPMVAGRPADQGG
ncbi:MAG: metallopeptidase TldD-related protein [Acidobacteriota bacterium]